jgi:hypothetical protein
VCRAPALQPPPPSIAVTRLGNRDQCVTRQRVSQRLPIDPHLATDTSRRATLDLAADDDEVLIDTRRRAENDVGVHGNDASPHVPGQHQRAAQHGNVAVDRSPGLDVETLRGSEPASRIEK